MNKITNYIRTPKSLLKSLIARCGFIPDELYVKLQFRIFMGYWPNLRTPTTLSEKLNWLKLYYHNPLLHKLVDKATNKQYVTEKIGSGHTIPTIGLWDDVDSIDFEKLPSQFVLKCTHDSGSVCICRDKDNVNFESIKKKLHRGLGRNYFLGKREWAYKDLKPRIIAEPFLPYIGKPDSVEYKLTVYNGKVRFITVCIGIAHSTYDDRTNDHFTPEWNHLPFAVNYKSSGRKIEKPPFMDEMIQLTEKLAEGLPQVRVDWYAHDNAIIFGEMTFYTWAGYLNMEPKEWDERLGQWLELPKEKLI